MNQKQEQFKENNTWLYILLAVFGIASSLLTIRACSVHKPSGTIAPISTQNKTTGDTWQRAANDWKKVASMNAIKIQPSIADHNEYYNTNITMVDTSGQTIMKQYKRLRDITDSLFLFQIDTQDKVIAAQDSSNKQYRKQISVDSSAIVDRDRVIVDTVKVLNKLGKKKYWKGFRHGLVTGVVFDRGVQAVGKLIKN